MAADIIPIQLGLTDGNVYTLWAPQWLEDGEEWEAFLGHGDDLYVFPSPAHLAAFIRSSDEHDLIDHPEWDTAAELLVDELRPDDDHVFDIVGVPDLVAEIPDIWTLAALTDTISIVRSLADVCDLEVVDEILGAADGFAVLPLGQTAFTGRNGEKLWNEMGAVIAERWDEVIDAIDAIVKTPEIDAEELTSTRAELAAISAVDKTGETVEPEEDQERDEDLEFWDETGVDCLEITVGDRTGYTLRCYLGDEPVFLAENHRIKVYSSAEELENYLMTADVTHRLSTLEVWPEIRTAVTDGEAAVLAGPENTYRLDGLADALKGGPEEVDGKQLELAVELLIDGALERGDEETVEAVGSSTPLGNLISAITRPDPDRLAPSPPFDDEAAAWSVLVERFAATLDWDGTRG